MTLGRAGGPPLLCTATEPSMSSSPAAPSHNEALAPVSPDRRVFQWHDHASLWFSLGVGLLVMQVGAYLMPALGTKEALIAIVAGSIVGAGLLGWVAKLGCDSGLASAGLMHAVYGRTFASLPIILNIVQLVGWGTFELVVMRDATVAIGQQSGAMAGSHWRVLVALTLPSKDLVQALLLAQGGLIALSLILIDEVDNAYGDTYSGAVSAHSLLPRWGVRKWGLAMAVVCTGLALVLPMHSLEPFLLLLSSVFVPLFGVILGRLAFGADAGALLHGARGVHAVPVAIWIGGIACFHLLPRLLPQAGSSLPTLALCFALAFLTRPQIATNR